jgi:two-component system sensor histidine kinase TctE
MTPGVATMSSGLQRRLLVLLLVPLCLLALLNMWFDYRSADNAALQQDRQLQRFTPLLADSVVGAAQPPAELPLILLAPPLAEFLKVKAGQSAFAMTDLDGRVLAGESWVAGETPSTREPVFFSTEEGGLSYRIVGQRMQTAAGELVVYLADGSDSRQQWAGSLWIRVLLPNLVLMLLTAAAINWAIKRALRPLIELRQAVENRNPSDLSAIDARATPEEVRPLVLSLNRLFDLVQAQVESQRRFVADAAHQLRMPLAGLQTQVEAWAQLANAANRPAQTVTLRRDQIDALRQATRRTSQLANQLLALSRADARSLQTQEVQRVDLKALCENLLEMHLDAASEKHLDLGLETQPVVIMGHEWLLRELLGNLLDNAIKYTPAGGTVTLRCGQAALTAGGAFLEVEDDGPGVAPAERARVLDRFYRVPGSSGEGSGLGLAIADEIARVHGSELLLRSGARGRGLRVTLIFPV